MSTNEPAWRQSPDEMREAVVRAGVRLVTAEGVSLGAERISLERAAANARVSRAAAYRLWQGLAQPPSDAFRLEVLSSIASEVSGNDEEVELTADAVGTEVEQAGPLEDLSDEERRALFLRMVATGTRQNIRFLLRSSQWHAYVAVLAAACSRLTSEDPPTEETEAIVDALRRGEDRAVQKYAALYLTMSGAFGLRLRTGYAVENFATAAGALAEGVALRSLVSTFVEPAGPYDLDGQMTLFGSAFLGLVREFFEPDPDAAWSVSL